MWTRQKVERLTAMWADGYSASMIAADIGDVTRNAVIGKVHRLGLPTRGKTPRIQQPKAPRKPRKPRDSRFPVGGSRPLRFSRFEPQLHTHRPEPPTKTQLYAMLAEAARNTAAL